MTYKTESKGDSDPADGRTATSHPFNHHHWQNAFTTRVTLVTICTHANSPLPKKACLRDCKLETPETDEKRNQTNTQYIGELGSRQAINHLSLSDDWCPDGKAVKISTISSDADLVSVKSAKKVRGLWPASLLTLTAKGFKAQLKASASFSTIQSFRKQELNL